MKVNTLKALIQGSQPKKIDIPIKDSHKLSHILDDVKERYTYELWPIKAKSGELSLKADVSQENQESKFSALELKGDWRMLKDERLRLDIKGDASKKLTFKGQWQVRDNTLTYVYESVSLKTKKKIIRDIEFDGRWVLNQHNHLVYQLKKGEDTFTFKGALQSPSILAKKNEIRYQLGVGSARSARAQSFTLFGKWKFSRKFGLDFEIVRSGRSDGLSFGVTTAVSDSTSLSLELSGGNNKPLGVELVLEKEFLKKNAQGFIRWQKNTRQELVEAGISLKW